jgi:hypothetical protein
MLMSLTLGEAATLSPWADADRSLPGWSSTLCSDDTDEFPEVSCESVRNCSKAALIGNARIKRLPGYQVFDCLEAGRSSLGQDIPVSMVGL